MKIRKVLFSAMLMILLSFYSFGHSGRTDSNGGHYNRSTGVYHDHNGSSATGWIILFGIIVVIAFVSSKRNNKK